MKTSGTKNLKKVTLFVPTLRGGGAERVMINLARGFVNSDVDVDLVVRAKGAFLSDVPAEVRLIDLHATRVLMTLPGLVRYLRREKPTVVLSAMAHANIIAIWAIKIARVNTRLVVSVHNTLSRNLDLTSLIDRLQLLLTRLFYRWADAIVVVSEEAKKDFLTVSKLKPKLIKVIYNPVVIPEMFEKSKIPVSHPWLGASGPPVIMGVGRLSKQKDFSTLIRAFFLVQKQHSARLIIIGEGEERIHLEKLVKELGVIDLVDLHGFVENPYSFLSHANVFVLSSAWEGLPTVLIEALALGVPVVSTDCPSGPREILDNGKHGSIVPVGDDKALAEAILYCLKNSQPKKIPGEAWKRFELDRVTKQYLEILSGNI